MKSIYSPKNGTLEKRGTRRVLTWGTAARPQLHGVWREKQAACFTDREGDGPLGGSVKNPTPQRSQCLDWP